MGEHRVVSGHVADGPGRALVLAAFVAAAALLGVAASRAERRAPASSSPGVQRSSP
jgi:hypothetical protein